MVRAGVFGFICGFGVVVFFFHTNPFRAHTRAAPTARTTRGGMSATCQKLGPPPSGPITSTRKLIHNAETIIQRRKRPLVQFMKPAPVDQSSTMSPSLRQSPGAAFADGPCAVQTFGG